MTVQPTNPCPTRRGFLAGAGALGAMMLAGCTNKGAVSGSAAGSGAGTGANARTVRMGTMMTEDFLPGWVAAKEQMFPASVNVEVTEFQSAQELSAAVTAGEIDMAMTDPQVSASLTAGGTPVRMRWIALGATPQQGIFGIMVGPDSAIKTADQLRGASIGVGSNTVPEYVMDKLLEIQGIGEGDFTKEEIKKMPVRFEMMTSGKVDAAALPNSLLELGKINGCTVIMNDAQDSDGQNLSQSVVVVREAFEDEEAIESETTRMLEHFDFPKNLWDLYPNTFSGGEKLRLNIARAMVRRPRFLLLDEPTASLDNASKAKVRELIEQLKASGTTMLGIFHDLEFMEGVCDREYNMQAGGFVAGSSVAE